jgi:hypothetical protein
MADYFLVHDRSLLEDQLRPALSAAWRERSFAPCLPLCRDWAAVGRDYAERYHVNPDDILLLQLNEAFVFDRAFWRVLVGEVLLFSACEIPEFANCFDTLLHLLTPLPSQVDVSPREQQSAISQALHGSRDLAFGRALYRPEYAGWNNVADVARLADWLASICPDAWTPNDLASLPGLDSDEDRAEELEFAREWFVVLADLYHRSAAAGRVIVLERTC